MPTNKRFIVRKYIMAETAAQALRKEKHFQADDVYLDDQWIKDNPLTKATPIKGFAP